VKAVFVSRLRKHFPLQTEKILNRIREVREGKLSCSEFGERHRGKGPYWENIGQVFDLYGKRLGLNQNEPSHPREPFHRPTAQREMSLF
jgi:DNA repair photolyase